MKHFLKFLGMDVLCCALFRQDYRGQIAGKVIDPSGAAIPAAMITMTNVATNASSATRAGETGNYTVP